MPDQGVEYRRRSRLGRRLILLALLLIVVVLRAPSWFREPACGIKSSRSCSRSGRHREHRPSAFKLALSSATRQHFDLSATKASCCWRPNRSARRKRWAKWRSVTPTWGHSRSNGPRSTWSYTNPGRTSMRCWRRSTRMNKTRMATRIQTTWPSASRLWTARSTFAMFRRAKRAN